MCAAASVESFGSAHAERDAKNLHALFSNVDAPSHTTRIL
jgi:hypothetical protein